MNPRTGRNAKAITAVFATMAVIIIALLCANITMAAAATTAQTTYSSTDYPIISTTLVSTDPSPAIAGELLDVRVGFVNQGGHDSDNISATFMPSYPFTLVPSNEQTQSVGYLQAYQGSNDASDSKTITYTVLVDKNAPAGTYDFTVDYTQGGSSTVEIKLPIEVKTSDNEQTITIDKTILNPGTPTNVTFTINNDGNAPLKNLIFTWSNSADSILPIGGDNTRYVKNIDIGASAQLPFTVIADTNANAGLYRLDLSLSYEDALNSTITKLVDTTAGIYIGGGTDFDAAYSESSSGLISLSIANVGNNPASSVSVIIPPQAGWRVSGSNEAIIGNLNKGDYTAVSFTLQQTSAGAAGTAGTGNFTRTGAAANGAAGSGAAGNFSGRGARGGAGGYNATGAGAGIGAANSNMLTVQIAYTDTTGQRQTVTKQVMISGAGNASGAGAYGAGGARVAATKSSFLSTYGWYILILVLIVGGIYWYRKKKNMPKDDMDDDNIASEFNASTKSSSKKK